MYEIADEIVLGIKRPDKDYNFWGEESIDEAEAERIRVIKF